MELRHSARARAERVVATARLAFALFAFFALQPLPLEQLVSNGRALFGALYLFFAGLALVASFRRIHDLPAWTIASHAVDVVFFSTQLFLPPHEALPRFVAVLFPVIAAVSIFQWRQALITCVAVGAAFIAASAYSADVPDAGSLDAMVVGGASFVILIAILLFDRSREEKLEREISSLSTWPLEVGETVPVREILTRAGSVLKAPRLIMAWEEPDEPWLHIAWNHRDEFQWIRESPAKYDPLVVDQLSGKSFIARELPSASSVVYLTEQRYREVKLDPIDSRFKRDYAITDVLTLHLEGSTFSGHLFVVDSARRLTPDDLIFGEVVATFAASRLDHYYLLQRAQQLAIGQERIRLSRDLHDGVLQSLTGAALQLEAARTLIESDPEEARRRLTDIQKVLAADQRELRAFVRHLRPSAASIDSEARLTTRLATLTDRFRQQWGVKVSLDTSGMMHLVSQPLRHEIYSIVNEAVANAAKHAGALRVDVRISATADQVQIEVRDDGSGFPFTGRHDLASLNQTRRGPVSLKERITSLNGDLVIDSSPAGSQLQITIPLSWVGA